MNRTGSKADSVVARFVVGLIGTILVSLEPIGTFPNAAAAPSIPDIGSLIDDTGPLDTRVVGINGGRAIFLAPSMVFCVRRQWSRLHSRCPVPESFPGRRRGRRL